MGKKAILAILVLLLPACAATRITPSGGNVYHLTPEQADHVLQLSMSEEFPGDVVTPVVLPAKGYSVGLNFGLDHHSVAAYALPAEGGYRFKVDSSGTMILQGELKAKGLFKKIVAHASTESKS